MRAIALVIPLAGLIGQCSRQLLSSHRDAAENQRKIEARVSRLERKVSGAPIAVEPKKIKALACGGFFLALDETPPAQKNCGSCFNFLMFSHSIR